MKKYKFFLPAEIYLRAVFMQFASKFRVFPLVLKFRDSFASVYCCTPLVVKYIKISKEIIKSKRSLFHIGRIPENKFTDAEMEILAFTFSLVGAIKAVIDSPILSRNGTVFNGNDSKLRKVEETIEIFKGRSRELLV